MKQSMAGILIFSIALLVRADGNRFKKRWYDGNGEIAVYKLTESRYGEPRSGRRVMIFVTEPLRKSTLVKPDNRLPDDSIVRVIKLNDVREFVTGIYNYSVTTSVFQTVENSGPYHRGAAVKVALSSQEWCGMVYDRMLLRKEGYSGKLFSYFEKESERDYVVPSGKNPIPEENLWLLVRELQGTFCAVGESKQITMIPSMWSRRKKHVPVSTVTAVVSKRKLGKYQSVIGSAPASEFTWKAGESVTSVTVEADYPHHILAFSEPDGSQGKLIAVKRLPYWKLHKNKDLYLRKELGLIAEQPDPMEEQK